jgi:biotin operon repressor
MVKTANAAHVEPKKLIALYVLKILETETDILSCLTQTKIAEIISGGYTPCDRKTVGRSIACLQKAGYKIVHINNYGYYLDGKNFTVSESESVIKALESSGEISDGLILRVKNALNKPHR